MNINDRFLTALQLDTVVPVTPIYLFDLVELDISGYNNHQTFQVPKMDVLTYISCI